jgi:type II secretory pathway pseudopilin PulG
VIRSRGGNNPAGFSTRELVVVIVIVAVLLLLGWPTLSNALKKRDLTQTMNNGHELYLAAFRMATDGAAKANANLAWAGDYPVTGLAEYCNKMVQNDYIKLEDLQRVLRAPGAECIATMSGPPATLLLSGKPAFKLYKVKASDRSTTIFAASSNYVYDTPLNPNAVPFGNLGFIVVQKSGDAGIYKARQATVAGYDNDALKFQHDTGALPGAEKGQVVPGDGSAALTEP